MSCIQIEMHGKIVADAWLGGDGGGGGDEGKG